MEEERETKMSNISLTTLADCYNLFFENKWEKLRTIYLDNSYLIALPHTKFYDTAIHLAVHNENKDLVEALLKVVYIEQRDFFFGDDQIFRPQNKFGNTPLHEAASTGNKEIVKIIMNYDRKQLTTKNSANETPLFMAAVYGRTDVIKYLVKEVEKDAETNADRDIKYHTQSETSSMLHEAIRGYHLETALELINPRYRIETPALLRDDNHMTCFQLLANTPSAFKSGYYYSLKSLKKLIYLCLPENDYRYFNIWKTIAKVFPSIGRLWDEKKKHSIAVKLSEFLALKDESWLDKQSGCENDVPLFAAAKNGIKEIVETILHVSPQAIEHENHKNENIFHVAVEHRRLNVTKYLLQSCHISPRLMSKLDDHSDSILHKAAYNRGRTARERPGEALRLQSEIQWFERVKELVPPHHMNKVNNLKLTPQALFTKEHENLVKRGQAWLARTANSCIIVAVLIATVAYTSIYTVPGGSHKKLSNEPKKSGKPVFLNTTAFTVYTASDVASLCFAFTSVVVFLSISTSKMNEQDFRRSLPFKLMLGLSMLFWSVVALMSSFAAALQITMSHKLHQTTAAPIITLACFPAAFFLLLQLPLYVNISAFTIKDLLRFIGFIIPHKIPSTLKSKSYSRKDA